MKTHGNYCGLFSLLNQTANRGSGGDNEILNLFTQHFSGILSLVYACVI